MTTRPSGASALLILGVMTAAATSFSCADRPSLSLSGYYICTSRHECPTNWDCQANAQVCVAPGDPGFSPAGGRRGSCRRHQRATAR
jgi:hypothetical protein